MGKVSVLKLIDGDGLLHGTCTAFIGFGAHLGFPFTFYGQDGAGAALYYSFFIFFFHFLVGYGWYGVDLYFSFLNFPFYFLT
jgi:hypothetical protein